MSSFSAGVSIRARSVMSVAAMLAASGLASSVLRAQPASWDQPVTGFWNTAANWDPAVVPNGASFDVTIDVTGGLYDINLDINPTIGSLTVNSADATLQLGGNTINIVGAFDLNNGLIRGPGGGGGLTVGGLARFSGVSSDRDILGAGTLNFNGDVLFDCDDDVDICDTDVNYNGASMIWQGSGRLGGGLGSTYTISSSTTFTILNNDLFRHNGIGAAPTLINNGVIRKSTGSGTTEFLDVGFTNAGTLEVESGTVRSNGVSTAGNTLSGGTWNVFNGSTLELTGATITTNAATIHLRDAGSTFDQINGLTTNAAAGTLRISNGRNFTTAGGFTNNGTLNVGSGTTFQASSTFNQGSSTITGGGFVKAAGTATFNGPTTAPVIDGGTTFETSGGLVISGTSGLSLDSAGKILHKGSSGTWSGGAISMGDSTSITVSGGGLLETTGNQNITWNNAGTRPTFNVDGTFTKKTGAGITFLDGVSLTNSGTVRVESGTLRANQAPVTGGTLGSGKWIVKESTLDFVATSITTNNAEVTLDGLSASFAALENNLSTNGTTGVVSLAGDKDFLTVGNFTNNGRVETAPGSIFEVDGASSYTNFNIGTQTLTGGEIKVTSTSATPAAFRWLNPGFQVQTLAAKVTLSGTDSLIDNGLRAGESALNELSIIAATGDFEIADTREFRPTGDFIVEEVGPDRGRLAVAETSLFEVQDGFTLLNYNSGQGELSLGNFDVGGTLSVPGIDIRRVSSEITLKGIGQIINKTTGVEAIGSLEYITSTGLLTVRDGKDISVLPDPLVGPAQTLQVDGILTVGEGFSGNDSIMTVNGNFQQNAGSTVNVLDFGILNVVGVGPGTGNYTNDTGADLRFGGGTLQVHDTFTVNGTLSGSGAVVGSTVINGTISPGNSPGRLNFFGSLALNPTSELVIDLNNYIAGEGYDEINVAGAITIAPGATLTLLPVADAGFAFAYGQVFYVLDAMSIAGQFTSENITGTELGGGLYIHLDWNDPASLRLVVVPAPGAIVPALIGIGALAVRRRRR
jgi:hypothetical protein